MNGFYKISLRKLFDNIGENDTLNILSDFSCPLNPDIEYFLKKKAVEFEKQSISATHLIFTSYKNEKVLIGYYTLSIKSFNVDKSSISKTLRKRISKFATYDPMIKSYILPAPLLAQIGKNFTNDYNKLISGDELLGMAIDDIKITQQIIGGKVIYLECEDNDRLIEFYSSNGFVKFAERSLDKDETQIKGQYLVQMLRVLK
ncbi:MAG: N-acetyltransferase [Oscillospiraceae bacterium]|nr:N-acetyltransferase [Oscillospiraceae bacterium]